MRHVFLDDSVSELIICFIGPAWLVGNHVNGNFPSIIMFARVKLCKN